MPPTPRPSREPDPSAQGTSTERLGAGHRLAALLSLGRLHIAAIGGAGTFTFGWLFTGRYLFLLAFISAFDWLLVNLFNRVVDIPEDRLNAVTGTELAARYRTGILVGGGATLLASLVALHLVAPALTPVRLAYHALGLLYNWPLWPGRRRLKQLYFWKNTASATGFLLTVFAYPLVAYGTTAGVTVATLGIAALFFFLFELSYEIIYDLRDVAGDNRAQVRTYPVVHGVPTATRIVDGLLLTSMAILVIGYAAGLIPWRLFIMIAAPAIQLVLYKRALRRGITGRDCVGLTWLGVALLVGYHLWILAGLPGAAA